MQIVEEIKKIKVFLFLNDETIEITPQQPWKGIDEDNCWMKWRQLVKSIRLIGCGNGENERNEEKLKVWWMKWMNDKPAGRPSEANNKPTLSIKFKKKWIWWKLVVDLRSSRSSTTQHFFSILFIGVEMKRMKKCGWLLPFPLPQSKPINKQINGVELICDCWFGVVFALISLKDIIIVLGRSINMLL